MSPDEGNVSKWNEGDLKNLRLHEAQQLINSGKANPLRFNGEGFDFEIWIAGITNLYGEGMSKYKPDEIKETEALKNLLRDKIRCCPPYTILSTSGMGQRKTKKILNYDNWESILKIIELYERLVKYYNDIHGFSTGNVDYDLAGL